MGIHLRDSQTKLKVSDKHCLAVSSKSDSLTQVPGVQLLHIVNKRVGEKGQEIEPFTGTVSGTGGWSDSF